MTTTSKGKRKVWPQSLSKKQLLEEFYDVECQLDILDNELFELRRECERRKIDPYE